MDLIIFAIGLLTALLVGRFFVDNLSTVLYLQKYNTEEKFLDIYDTLDSSEVHDYFHLAKLDVAKDYNEFLKIHQHARERAWEVFLSYIRPIRNVIILIVMLLILVPFVIWQDSSLFFYAGFSIPALWVFIDRRFIKEHGKVFYLLVLLNAIFNDLEKMEDG